MNTRLLAAAIAVVLIPFGVAAEEAELILRNGKIVTVDGDFSIAGAMAIGQGSILRVGDEKDVDKARGAATKVIDLDGKTVIPGLIDSHVHATSACMTEFDHPIPDMETIADVLAYVKARAEALGPDKWIGVRQVFITRLREQRYPTRAELDAAAPHNPVLFSTGPDASVNSLAMQLSGIDKDFKVDDGGSGYVERDPSTGEPTGILRSCTRFVKYQAADAGATGADRLGRLEELLHDYNSVGITGIVDRNAGSGAVDQYRTLQSTGRLSLRVGISRGVGTSGSIEEIQQNIRRIADDPLRKGDAMLRIIGIKTFLDGGMLTGSAYMRKPWGVSEIYSITDPEYRGLLYIPRDRLVPIVRTCIENGMQFTAHSVGDGAVHTLLDVYEEINRTLPIRDTRPCITHSNFMSAEAVEKAARLGVIVDIQPAWLYLDTRTLTAQFGYDRLRYFQPLASIFRAGGIAGGGSDHMQKIGSLRSVNPYNPFLGMWVTIARRGRWYDGVLHPEEALTREQALRFYTINNAYLMSLEKQTGSLEPGKLADFAILDRDILTCELDALRGTKVVATYVNGRRVFEQAGGFVVVRSNPIHGFAGGENTRKWDRMNAVTTSAQLSRGTLLWLVVNRWNFHAGRCCKALLSQPLRFALRDLLCALRRSASSRFASGSITLPCAR